jgi:hypothetical protein
MIRIIIEIEDKQVSFTTTGQGSAPGAPSRATRPRNGAGGDERGECAKRGHHCRRAREHCR